MPIISIKKLIAKGLGITHFNEKTGFVPFSLPDETLDISILEEKKKTFTGSILKIIVPSDKRITPECPYFSFCGGCSFQHLDYTEQLNAKKSVFKEQWNFIGKQASPVTEIHDSPDKWQYRNKVEWNITTNEGKLAPAFYQWNASLGLLPISRCRLIKPVLQKTGDLLFDWLNQNVSKESRKKLQRISLQQFENNEIYCGITVKKQLQLNENDLQNYLLNHLEAPRIDIAILVQGKKNLSFSNSTPIEPFFQKLPDSSIQVSGGSFMQVNQPQFDEILKTMKRWAQSEVKQEQLIDLYCGAGSITFSLLPFFSKVRGYEVADKAIQNALNTSKKIQGDIHFQVLNLENRTPDFNGSPSKTTLVVDPPRRGCSKSVIEWIKKHRPANIYYLSCDGATFSRDIQNLADLYKTEELHLWDMFPQTHHLEVLGKLSLIK